MGVALIVAVLVLVVVGLAGSGLLLVRRQQRSFARANEVVPGVATSAPASWAGSHDRDARLHRRLRDAMTTLRAVPDTALDGAGIELRVELEQHALALDESLVAVAAGPAGTRGAGLARISGAVEAVEQAVAEMATARAGRAASAVEASLARGREQAALLAAARTELDAILATPPAAEEAAGDPAASRPDPEPDPG